VNVITDEYVPNYKNLIRLDTNVPDPNKKVKKGAKAPEDPDKPQATLYIKNGDGEEEEVPIIGDRISQTGLGIASRFKEQGEFLTSQFQHLKAALWLAHQKGIPIREGSRGLDTSATPSDGTPSYMKAHEDLFKLVTFLLEKFREDFEKDETAQQMLVDLGVLIDEDDDSYRVATIDEHKKRYATPGVSKKFKITVTG